MKCWQNKIDPSYSRDRQTEIIIMLNLYVEKVKRRMGKLEEHILERKCLKKSCLQYKQPANGTFINDVIFQTLTKNPPSSSQY